MKEEEIKEQEPRFHDICLPGLLEDMRLSLYITQIKDTELYLVFSCEDKQTTQTYSFNEFSNFISMEFTRRKIKDTLN